MKPDPFKDALLACITPVQVVHDHYTDTDIPVRLGTAEAIWADVRAKGHVCPVCYAEKRVSLTRAGFSWVVIQGKIMYLYQRRDLET